MLRDSKAAYVQSNYKLTINHGHAHRSTSRALASSHVCTTSISPRTWRHTARVSMSSFGRRGSSLPAAHAMGSVSLSQRITGINTSSAHGQGLPFSGGHRARLVSLSAPIGRRAFTARCRSSSPIPSNFELTMIASNLEPQPSLTSEISTRSGASSEAFSDAVNSSALGTVERCNPVRQQRVVTVVVGLEVVRAHGRWAVGGVRPCCTCSRCGRGLSAYSLFSVHPGNFES